ncbi:hypothetical protein BU15DRAFT_84280 [Melanogaster broomeanus]|nr:hypothetical protein BU15DRAFT_84280 [Melanogaster broomeanus]
MEILKGALTHPNSPDYRPDIDALTPVQASVMDAIQDVDLAGSGITYVALSKKTVPSLVELYLRFKDRAEIYENGTLEAVYSVPAAFLGHGKKWSLSGFEFVTFPVYVQAYTIPIKLKYDFPAPSKFGNDLPPRKTATMCFLHIVTAYSLPVASDNRTEAIWRQIIEGFRGGILADCLEEREVEETFDLRSRLTLFHTWENHAYLTTSPLNLRKILHQGSQLYKLSPDGSHPGSAGLGNGTSSAGSSRNSREKFIESGESWEYRNG